MCGIRVRWRRRISIHAPPRGATKSMPGQSTRRRFQFTPLREGRPASLPSAPWWTLFQFTPLREGRQATAIITRERKEISIHAPPRGATVHRRSSRKPSGDFNSRPSARGDKCINHTVSVEHISIHAPPRGATGIRRILPEKICGNFNSRPSARGDGNPWEKRTGGAVLDLSEDKVAGRADHDQLRPALQYHPFVSLFAR